MEHNRTGDKEMKRPSHIYDLLAKISDGTILNEKEFNELELYVSDLERLNPYSESTTPEQLKPQSPRLPPSLLLIALILLYRAIHLIY